MSDPRSRYIVHVCQVQPSPAERRLPERRRQSHEVDWSLFSALSHAAGVAVKHSVNHRHVSVNGAHSSADTGVTLIDLEAEQRRRNEESRDAWHRYARHRERVTELLLGTAGDDSPEDGSPRTRRLCLLGAGNCNDVDLKRLAETFDEIHLVDLDEDALADGVRRARLENAQGTIHLHAGLDLCGVFSGLANIDPTDEAATQGDIAALAEAAMEFSTPAGLGRSITAGFDTVASVGLLSQLIEGILSRIPNPETALPLITAVRTRHLRLLLQLARPGGYGVLVTEIVSSDSASEIASTSEEALPVLLRNVLQQENFFTGLNPAALLTTFHNDPELSQIVARVQTHAPWKWDFLYRTYAVTAFVVGRKP
ncbi:MAG: hypothetical protein ACI8P0_005593 [Planctomycetaceae bacterium]|jgi:hypothetical protein